MKATPITLPETPIIVLDNNTILINDVVYSQPVVLNNQWDVSILSTNPIAWLSSPTRETCNQIFSWPSTQPNTWLLDQYWSQGIALELLSIHSALITAKAMIAENHNFQLVIFPVLPELSIHK
jgi:hypothetical protein